MNKSFKTNAMSRVLGKQKALAYMKWLSGQSCHIKVGESMSLNDHPLKDEIFKMIDDGEIIFS